MLEDGQKFAKDVTLAVDQDVVEHFDLDFVHKGLNDFVEVAAENGLDILAVRLWLDDPEEFIDQGVVIVVSIHLFLVLGHLGQVVFGDSDCYVRLVLAPLDLLIVLIIDIDLIVLVVPLLIVDTDAFPLLLRLPAALLEVFEVLLEVVIVLELDLVQVLHQSGLCVLFLFGFVEDLLDGFGFCVRVVIIAGGVLTLTGRGGCVCSFLRRFFLGLTVRDRNFFNCNEGVGKLRRA